MMVLRPVSQLTHQCYDIILVKHLQIYSSYHEHYKIL